MAIRKDEDLIRAICEEVIEAKDKNIEISPYKQTIYDVDYLFMEVNSGVSFEQYFRWASVEEIKRIENSLNRVGLNDIAKLTKDAIDVAFPNGLPNSNTKKDELTYWTQEQEEKLESLFTIFQESNSKIVNTLAKYAKGHLYCH